MFRPRRDIEKPDAARIPAVIPIVRAPDDPGVADETVHDEFDDPDRPEPAQQAIRGLPLKQALLGAEAVAGQISAGLGGHREIASLGLEILDVSVLAIKPTPETARALEAEAQLGRPLAKLELVATGVEILD